MIDRDTYIFILGCVVEEMTFQRQPDLITRLFVRKERFYSDLFLDSTDTPIGILIQDRVNNRSYRMAVSGYSHVFNNWCCEYAQAIELETKEDLMEKFSAIVSGQDYDTRIKIPIELPDDELMRLMLMAHEKDITFNELIIQILMDEVKKVQNEQQS